MRALIALALVSLLVGPARSQCQPDQPCYVGDWSTVWEYNNQVCSSYACPETVPVEFYHAALIPVGTYKGMVLLLRVDINASCTSNNTTQTWVFNPMNPESILKVEHNSYVPGNQNCGGQSWDRNGRLVLAGGPESPQGAQPNVECYRFDPRQMGQIQFQTIDPVLIGGVPPSPCNNCTPAIIRAPNAWKRIGDMHIARYYPSLIPLIRWATAGINQCILGIDGANAVMGGPPKSGHSTGNEVFELLNPDDLENPSGQWSCPLIPDGYEQNEHGNNNGIEDFPFSVFERYQRKPTTTPGPPNPLLDSYPQAVQMSGKGQILVAGDTITADGTEPSGYGVTLTGTEAWAMAIAYAEANQPQWELWRGIDMPTGHDYGNTAILFRKKLLPNGDLGILEPNRILVFGGSHRFDAPVGAQIIDLVHEFEPTSDVDARNTGFWKTKTPMASRRKFSNAVVLPDGTIFIVGGNTTFWATYPNCDPGLPQFQPELYEPGNRGEGGSTRLLKRSRDQMWSCPMPAMPSGPVPHLYHSMAVLLSDGSVFVVGGKTYGNCGGPTGLVYPDSRLSGEIYYPPYLYNDDGTLASRPLITGLTLTNTANDPSYQALSTGSQAQTFTVGVTTQEGPVKRVSILRPAAVTHHFDSDQRFIDLEFTVTNPQLISVRAPDEDIAPQGYYMLFVLEKKPSGRLVPSRAEFVRFL